MEWILQRFAFQPPSVDGERIRSSPSPQTRREYARGIHCLVCDPPAYRKSKHPDRPKKVIVYCHGNATDLCDDETQDLIVQAANRLDVRMVGIEYPGYGWSASQGPSSIKKTNRALELVVQNLIEDEGWRQENIWLWGYSIGSGPVCNLAGKRFYRKLGGVILQSPFSSLNQIAYEVASQIMFGKGPVEKDSKSQRKASFSVNFGNWVLLKLSSNVWDNSKAVQNLTCPLVIFHGDSDEIVSVSHSREIYRQAKNKSQGSVLRLCKDTTHNHWYLERDIWSLLDPVMN